MNPTRHLRRLVGAAALSAAIVGVATPAHASPVPPKANPALLGTWVNTNASSNSVKQVVIGPGRVGNVTVDAFGACVPTLCEWGVVPATVYGPNVSSLSGATFQSNQRFLSNGKEWSRTTLLGNLTKTSLGLRLTLRELTVFEDGSGRKNYNVTETFAKSDGQKPTRGGNSVAGYALGAPPALVTGALGSWKNVSSTGALAAVKIAGTTSAPIVNAFGRCTPTACDWGRVRGITYGSSISSTTGATLLAPYTFAFKKAQLVIKYARGIDRVERLTVAEYNEFTDGSGRSNYAMTETFVRA
jgi:hypothetical protein